MRRKLVVRYVWIPVFLLAATLTTLGVNRGEFAVVTQWAYTLCTSCIGLR